jgi:DnaJ-domain-containing protein 1
MDKLIDLTDDGGNDHDSVTQDRKATAPAAVSESKEAEAKEVARPLAWNIFASLPIGAEISADVVDLLESDCEPEDQAPLILVAAKRSLQNHPQKYIKASLKRKRERIEAKKLEQLRMQKAKAQAAAFDPRNIPGGCNFIVIDDDSSEGDESNKPVDQDVAGAGKATVQQVTQDNSKKQKVYPRGNITWSERKPAAAAAAAARKVYKHSSENMFCRERDYNFHISQETAFEIQERMFREAAERVARLQATIQVTPNHQSETIVAPMFDVADRHPDHWRWKEPYACLGLPRHSSLTLVKSQYRRLAKLYHPDKSKHTNATDRFHGIAKAYRKLSQYDE